jgi:hypothetical protein
MKILDRVAAYYAVTKINEREMFHLHELIWLMKNIEFSIIQDRVKSDSDFTIKMIQYLKIVIRQSLMKDLSKLTISFLSSSSINSKNDVNDDTFIDLLNIDVNHVAVKKNMHKHIVICHKYDHKDCKFNFLRTLKIHNEVDEHEVIHLKRNHAYVNAFNSIIISCFRFNHDIQWISINVKTLSFLYYITNYVIKNDVFSFHIFMKTALIKQKFNRIDQNENSHYSNNQRSSSVNKFVLQCFNKLSQNREINEVQIANCFLNLFFHYTNIKHFITINLWTLRQNVRRLNHDTIFASLINNSFESLIEKSIFWNESCRLQNENSIFYNHFDNYRWRKSSLKFWFLFEYFMLIQIISMRDFLSIDISFENLHSACE